ncbi:alpha/beta hydrolase [Nocardioides sp.]|uniref:alpha/beta hydrolase n=1 Tax=Nocardioides sp. TaxID=35761 RepID=UPI0035B05ADE
MSTHVPVRTRAVIGSLALGALAASLMVLVVVPGATEGVSVGAALLGFALGWATLGRSLRWALVPAASMAAAGVLLVVLDPSDRALGALAWAWPPVILALAGWTSVQARRSLSGAGRWLVAAVLAVLVVASAGAWLSRATTDPFADTHPAPGTTVSVGDHRLHLDCRGQGSPTVVLLSGLGEFSASWARIVDGVAPATRVCAYDRAGQGWSDDVDRPQDGLAAAADLHELLAAAGEQGPFVLAGHSIGGPYAMAYAHRYPDEVAGLVLLDGTSPRQLTDVPGYPLQYAVMRRAYGVLPTLARLGLGSLLAGSHLAAEDAATVDAMAATPRAARNGRDELSVLPEVLRQARALTSLGDRPLVVLTSAENARSTDGWEEAQVRMATLSSDSDHREVEASHAGVVEDPLGAAASVKSIASVVEAVRAGDPVDD